MNGTLRTSEHLDLTTWEIGPYHGALPGPMRLELTLDGEIISRSKVETGFLHRGLEKACERHSWLSIIPYVDHLDPEFAIFGELALCQAVEEIGNLCVPQRAKSIRVILCELSRISEHLSYIIRLAKSVGSETIIHYVLRDREKVLDLFELLTGARFSINFLRYGGVHADVTEGFIERVLEVCDLIQVRMKEYNDIFTFNHSFLNRTSCLAPISEDLALACGMTGPNARAAGLKLDLRKSSPYLIYDQIDFEIPFGKGEGGIPGDVHDRSVVRLREIAQSIEILKQVVEKIPQGEFLNSKVTQNYNPPAGEAYSRVESGRGILGCHVFSDGTSFPNRVQFRPASLATFMSVPNLISGIRIEDLPLVLASLDLGIAEADR